MKRTYLMLVTLAAIATYSNLVHAHHSRSNFDLDTTIKLEGVVTSYGWRNPHVFVDLAIENENGEVSKWTVELNSTPVLARYGWARNTLKPGEHVIVTGSPDKNTAKRFMFGTTFTRDDGSVLWARGEGAIPVSRGPLSPEQLLSKDFTGVWRRRRDPNHDPLAANDPDAEIRNVLPLNERGMAELAATDPIADNPEFSCGVLTIPQLLFYPYPFKLTHTDDNTLRIVYEVNVVERTIHLNMKDHPQNAPRSPFGHSIGKIEDNVLTIETAHFDYVPWGNGEGVDSSEQRTTTEHYTLSDDGRSLNLDFTMSDPTYLSKNYSRSQVFDLDPGYELREYICDPETARRHLNAGKQ